MKHNRGFFEIGIMQGKNSVNLGTLWRSANIMGAAGIFTIGARYPKKHQTDTMNTPKHVPLREFPNPSAFEKSIPRGTKVIAIELDGGAESLVSFKHPERAIYLLGSEDKGLPKDVINKCDMVIKIPFDKNSFNVAVCGSIIMYDRHAKALTNQTII